MGVAVADCAGDGGLPGDNDSVDDSVGLGTIGVGRGGACGTTAAGEWMVLQGEHGEGDLVESAGGNETGGGKWSTGVGRGACGQLGTSGGDMIRGVSGAYDNGGGAAGGVTSLKEIVGWVNDSIGRPSARESSPLCSRPNIDSKAGDDTFPLRCTISVSMTMLANLRVTLTSDGSTASSSCESDVAYAA